MRKLILILALISTTSILNAQQLLYTSEFGGENSNGAIISYDFATGQTSNMLSLEGNPFYGYQITHQTTSPDYTGGLMMGSDGNYYGISSLGTGVDNSGATSSQSVGFLYRMDPVTTEWEILYYFKGNGEYTMEEYLTNGGYGNGFSYPKYKPVEVSQGVFYGLARKGGTYDRGGVWKFDANTMTYSQIGSFSNQPGGIGYNASCPMIIGDNNNLYGVLKDGAGGADGYLYRVNTNTDVLEFVTALNPAGWVMNHPHGDIVYNSSSNTIYGTKDRFDSGSNWGGGVWSYNISSGTVTAEWTILYPELDVLGSNVAGIVVGNDAKYYVFTRNGGAHNCGTIIRYSPVGNTYYKVYDFPSTYGARNSGTGMIVSGNTIYGTCDFSGDTPQLWSYDYINGLFETLVVASDLSFPGFAIEHQILFHDNKVVGKMRNGAIGNAGSFFSYQVNTDQLDIILETHSRNGRGLIGELALVTDTVIYAWTGKGGLSNDPDVNEGEENGNLIKINTYTGQITELVSGWELAGTENAQSVKWSRPLQASNGKLYYVVKSSSFFTNYFFYEYDISTGNFSIIDDLFPGSLRLFTMTGPSEFKTGEVLLCNQEKVRIYNTSTSALDLEKTTHNRFDYGAMKGNVILASDGRIYGTTRAYNFPDLGMGKAVIYSLDTVNYDFQIEHVFDTLIRMANTGLTELNGKLWGSTNYTGSNNEGLLFSYDISSDTYNVEYNFNRTTDGGGFEAEWTPYQAKLYTTSRTGGQYNNGTFVEYDPSTSTLVVKEHLTTANGNSFKGSPLLFIPHTLDSIVPNTGEQNQLVQATIYGSNTFFSTSSDVSLVNPGDPSEVVQGAVTSVLSDTVMEVEFDISINATTGLYDLHVDGLSLANAFTVTQVIPLILSMNPDIGEQGEQIAAEIQGENTQWTVGSPTASLTAHDDPGVSISLSSVTVVSDIEIDVEFDILSTTPAGSYDLHVDTLTLDNAFFVLEPGLPYLLSIMPDTAVQGTSVVCTIEAINTDFTQGGTPVVSLQNQANPAEEITGVGVVVVNDEELEAGFDIPLTATVGLYRLIVDNLTLEDAFTVLNSGAQLVSANPDSAAVGTFIPVEILATGTMFQQLGISSVTMSFHDDPSDILNAISFTVVNDTIIDAEFGFPANTSLGMWDIHVDSYMLENGFEVYDFDQMILSVDPDTASQGDFTTVTISCTGTYFTQETPEISMSYHDDPQETVNAISLQVVNDSVVEASFGFSLTTSAGFWDVHVDDIILPNGFTVLLLTNVMDNTTNSDFILYPNPSNGHVYIQGNNPIDKIRVMNMTGKLIEEQIIESEATEIMIDLGNYNQKGIFFVSIFTEESIVTRKVIIH